MKRLNLIIAICIMLASADINAQMFKEQIVDLSKKAATGTTYDIEATPSEVIVDDARQQIDIIYTTKTKRKLIKFDVIQLDYDLNVVSQYSDELEVEKARSKYPWFRKRYRGDTYSIVGITAETDLAGKLVVKKQETSFSYNWFSGKYKKKVKTLDKTKFKIPNAKKPTYGGHLNNPETGDAVVLAGLPDKFLMVKTYAVMVIDKDLNVKSNNTLDLKYAHRRLYSGAIATENDDESTAKDLVLVYAAAGGKGVYKPKVNADPNVKNFTYVRISPEGKIKEQINFDTKVLNWDIAGITEKNGDVYIYGSGETKSVGENHQKLLSAIGQGKQDAFQVVKVSNGKADFVSAPKLAEINAASVKPPNQKKVLEYKGKKVEIRGINITSNGDVFINAQDYVGGAIKGAGGYQDLYMFHFASDGSFKRFYGVKSSQDKGGAAGLADAATNPRQYPTNGTVFEGANGKLNWVMEVVEDVAKVVRTYSDATYTYWIPQRNLRVGQIDIASGKIDSFEVLGDGKYYLYNNLKPVQINGGKQTLYMGAGGKNRRELWVVKYDPTKG